MQNKKLIFVVHNLGLGGAQKMLVYVAETCLGKYQTVQILALSDQKTELSINTRIMINKLHYSFYTNKIKKIIKKIETIKEIHNYLLRENPDAVCVFGLDAFLI